MYPESRQTRVLHSLFDCDSEGGWWGEVWVEETSQQPEERRYWRSLSTHEGVWYSSGTGVRAEWLEQATRELRDQLLAPRAVRAPCNHSPSSAGRDSGSLSSLPVSRSSFTSATPDRSACDSAAMECLLIGTSREWWSGNA